MSEIKKLDWSGVHAALDQFYATLPEREAMVAAVECNSDVYKWEAAKKAASDLVREAFYEATSDRNSRSNCMLIDPWDAVKMSKYPVPAKYVPTGERAPVAETVDPQELMLSRIERTW